MASLSESRLRKLSRSRSTSTPTSSRTCSPRSNGSPSSMPLALWAMLSFPRRPSRRCSIPMTFCNDSTMRFWSYILRKALLFARRLPVDFPSIKVSPICFFTKTRSEFEILWIPLFSIVEFGASKRVFRIHLWMFLWIGKLGFMPLARPWMRLKISLWLQIFDDKLDVDIYRKYLE